MKDCIRGWELERQQAAKPRLERARSELPRGGKDMAAQIGAELRVVFPIPGAGTLVGTDELLARIKI